MSYAGKPLEEYPQLDEQGVEELNAILALLAARQNITTPPAEMNRSTAVHLTHVEMAYYPESEATERILALGTDAYYAYLLQHRPLGLCEHCGVDVREDVYEE